MLKQLFVFRTLILIFSNIGKIELFYEEKKIYYIIALFFKMYHTVGDYYS